MKVKSFLGFTFDPLFAGEKGRPHGLQSLTQTPHFTKHSERPKKFLLFRALGNSEDFLERRLAADRLNEPVVEEGRHPLGDRRLAQRL